MPPTHVADALHSLSCHGMPRPCSQARAVYEDGFEEDISFPDDGVRVVVPEKAAAVMPSSIVAAAAPAAGSRRAPARRHARPLASP